MSDNSIVGILLAIVVGLAFAGIGGYMYYGQQQAIQEHEPVDATVVNTNVDKEVDTDTDGDRETNFYARISYEYTVDGQTYTSDNIRPAGVEKSYNSRSGAEDFLSDYQSGEDVTAYYDPQSPDEAFLVKDKSTGLLAFAGIGGLVALFGVFGLVKKTFGLVT